MSSPHTALTHAEITRAQNVHNEVVAGTQASMNRLDNAIMGELMPQFRGDAAVALTSLHTRVQEDTAKFNQATQQMADQLGATSAKHAQNDAEGQSLFGRLANFLNDAGVNSGGVGGVRG